MRLSFSPAKTIRKIKKLAVESRKRSLLGRYDFVGYKRFYHYHCRKTAGTSIAQMFLAVQGGDGRELFQKLGQQSNESMLYRGLIYVGWDKSLIEQGDYFFGFSHIPFDEIEVPDGTYRFTSLRDPMERVVSHYRMLIDFSKQPVPHPCFATEGKWLGSSFDDFLDRVPREHLQNQLYMFSRRFDVDEAVERVSSLDFCFFVDKLDQCLERFRTQTGIHLKNRRNRISHHRFQLSNRQIARLKTMLNDEFKFYESARNRLLQKIG